MLSYPQALKTILRYALLLKPKSLSLNQCLGKVLAKNVESPMAFPGFNNSAVDGYAVRLPKRFQEKTFGLNVRGEIAAGDFFSGVLKPGQAMQIFTGAPVPRGTEAVVMQEQVERENGRVTLSKKPRLKENIRFRGEDFHKGALLLKQGLMLEPSHLAIIATVGSDKALVYPAPKVAILTTGNELLKPGSKPQRGKIYDSNAIHIEALVQKAGGIPTQVSSTGDTLAAIRTAVREGLKQDVCIIAGGVSVGKYDFVKEALKKEGVKEIFWKVNIKPGKPLYFGRKAGTLVFGLPGNPVSVFVTFEEFVKPALLKMAGQTTEPAWIDGFLTKPVQNGPRLHFMRVRCQKRKGRLEVVPLKGQGSHQIGALAKSNGLLKVAADAALGLGQKVRVKNISEGFL